MERTPLHVAYLNAFYHPLGQRDIPPYQGCIRVNVSNYLHCEAAPSRIVAHDLFRPIYFRFRLQRDSPDSFVLDRKALWAVNKAPLYEDQKEESISELPRPAKVADRKLLEILVRQLHDSADKLIPQCKSHRRYSPWQRRSFLSRFAPPLREGLEGKVWYETIPPKPIQLIVREKDFNSYGQEKPTTLPQKGPIRREPLSF